MPPYLDATARDLLTEARAHFLSTVWNAGTSYRPARRLWSSPGWAIARMTRSRSAQILGHIAQNEGASVRVFAAEPDTMAALRQIASDLIPDPVALAAPSRTSFREVTIGCLTNTDERRIRVAELDVNGTRALVQTLLNLKGQ